MQLIKKPLYLLGLFPLLISSGQLRVSIHGQMYKIPSGIVAQHECLQELAQRRPHKKSVSKLKDAGVIRSVWQMLHPGEDPPADYRMKLLIGERCVSVSRDLVLGCRTLRHLAEDTTDGNFSVHESDPDLGHRLRDLMVAAKCDVNQLDFNGLLRLSQLYDYFDHSSLESTAELYADRYRALINGSSQIPIRQMLKWLHGNNAHQGHVATIRAAIKKRLYHDGLRFFYPRAALMHSNIYDGAALRTNTISIDGLRWDHQIGLDTTGQYIYFRTTDNGISFLDIARECSRFGGRICAGFPPVSGITKYFSAAPIIFFDAQNNEGNSLRLVDIRCIPAHYPRALEVIGAALRQRSRHVDIAAREYPEIGSIDYDDGYAIRAVDAQHARLFMVRVTSIKVYSLHDCRLLESIEMSGGVWRILAHPHDPDLLLIQNGGGEIVLYNVKSKKEIRRSSPHPHDAQICFSHDGNSVYVSTRQSIIPSLVYSVGTVQLTSFDGSFLHRIVRFGIDNFKEEKEEFIVRGRNIKICPHLGVIFSLSKLAVSDVGPFRSFSMVSLADQSIIFEGLVNSDFTKFDVSSDGGRVLLYGRMGTNQSLRIEYFDLPKIQEIKACVDAWSLEKLVGIAMLTRNPSRCKRELQDEDGAVVKRHVLWGAGGNRIQKLLGLSYAQRTGLAIEEWMSNFAQDS